MFIFKCSWTKEFDKKETSWEISEEGGGGYSVSSRNTYVGGGSALVKTKFSWKYISCFRGYKDMSLNNRYCMELPLPIKGEMLG